MTEHDNLDTPPLTLALSHLLGLARGFEYAGPNELAEQTERIIEAVHLYDDLERRGPGTFLAARRIREIWQDVWREIEEEAAATDEPEPDE